MTINQDLIKVIDDFRLRTFPYMIINCRLSDQAGFWRNTSKPNLILQIIYLLSGGKQRKSLQHRGICAKYITTIYNYMTSRDLLELDVEERKIK